MPRLYHEIQFIQHRRVGLRPFSSPNQEIVRLIRNRQNKSANPPTIKAHIEDSESLDFGMIAPWWLGLIIKLSSLPDAGEDSAINAAGPGEMAAVDWLGSVSAGE